MFAIVDIAGQQYKVEKGQEIFVHRLEGDEGSKLSFDEVLLIEDKGKISVGTPTLKGARVSAKIISHLKGDKVVVFKKKRRKGYQKSTGHRDYLTKIEIDKISLKVTPVKEKEKAEDKPKPKAKAAATKTAVKKADKPAVKKTTKTTAAKKEAPVAKKTKEVKAKKEAKPVAEKKPAVKKPVKKTDEKENK